uniref:Trans-1,2-dihydrobenzene-1,2-diol dehydrogenase n=1 Tax=Ditylenchus dipsaci TaxID=166011 RepID=A0A915END0_9BILA
MAESKVLHWGILGCGRISNDFVRALKNCEHPNQVHAVATSDSKQRADKFVSDTFGLEDCKQIKGYGSYAELLNDPKIDVVYIGLLNHQHKQAVLDALDAEKHRSSKWFTKLSKKKKFLMEAYWTRFFPAWRDMPDLMQQIGEAETVLCDFGFERVNKTELSWGGGFLLATGCYPIMCYWSSGDKKTDVWGSVTLEYSGNRVANLFYSGLSCTPCQCSVSGPEGHLKMPEYFWCPSKVVKEIKGSPSTTLQFPIAGAENLRNYIYPNSSGLCYEADHVYECLQQGKLESDVMSLKESILLAEIFDEIRQQIGCIIYKINKNKPN